MTSCYKKSIGECYGLALDGAAINGDISEVCEELLSTVLRLHKFEQLRCIVDELDGFQQRDNSYLQQALTVVQVFPAMKTSCVSKRKRKGIFVYKQFEEWYVGLLVKNGP